MPWKMIKLFLKRQLKWLENQMDGTLKESPWGKQVYRPPTTPLIVSVFLFYKLWKLQVFFNRCMRSQLVVWRMQLFCYHLSKIFHRNFEKGKTIRCDFHTSSYLLKRNLIFKHSLWNKSPEIIFLRRCSGTYLIVDFCRLSCVKMFWCYEKDD